MSVWRTTLELARRRLAETVGGMTTEEMHGLLHCGGHAQVITEHRARLIIHRVRLVALLFAMLTPLWIVIDVLVLPWSLAWKLAVARLATSAAFFALALLFRDSERLWQAWVAVAIMFLIPTLFFLFSHPLISGRDMEGIPAALASGYAFLPFVMLAGLAIFPFTALETFVFASPVLIAQFSVAIAQLDPVHWQEHFGAFWLLMLIAVVAAFSSMSQLHFLNRVLRYSLIDPLTGRLNRRSGHRMLEQHLALAERQGRPLSVAFLDLDRFKSVNDEYGHDAGDQVLEQAAAAMDEVLRESDILVRWGGEEFVAILPEASTEGAQRAFERLLNKGLGTRPDGTIQQASVGLAERMADQSDDLEKLIQLADARMYAAKQAGGAQLCARDVPDSPPSMTAVPR